MKLVTFFEKFDQFADAPNAVAKMRELVLALAVQGKLVDQDPSDEPASKLLEQIKKQSRIIYQPVCAEDLPYEAPESWFWVRLGFLAEIERGGSPRPINDYITDDPDGLNWIKIGDTEKGGKYITSTNEKIRKDGLKKTRRVYPGDFLLTNSMSFGRPYITKIEGCIHDGWLRIHPPPQITSDYLYYLLSSSFVYAFFSNAAAGAVVQNLNADKVRELPIPLPPLAEQKRIVAKVDELMALCDRLEAQQQEREARHAALARASLSRFADAPSPANLPFLFHPSYAIPPADLRKSILTLAVQGKLVPQDPNDEPAEELISRLELERTDIAKEQGVRPPKNVPPLTADNFPHDIPESWQWSRIGHLALVIDYGTSQKADSDSSKVPVYRMGNIVGGRLVDENLKYVDSSIDDLPGLYLRTDDILFNRTNSYELVGKAGIYTGPDDTATFASYLIRIRLPDTLLFPPFYSVAMNAPYYRQTQIEPEVVQQCGQANFNGTKLASTIVPIPPLAEQRRIVAKVEQLMGLVGALETQLAASRATAANLLSAIVAELTGTTASEKVSASPTSGTGRRGRPRKSS